MNHLQAVGWLDIAIFTLIAISFALGLYRGFVKEVLSLTSWILAVWVAVLYYDNLAPRIAVHLESSELATVVAFLGLFFGTLIVCALIGYVVVKAFKLSGLTATDRFLGSLFGLIRAVAIALVVFYVAQFTPAVEQEWYQESLVVPYLEPLIEVVSLLLPTSLQGLPW